MCVRNAKNQFFPNKVDWRVIPQFDWLCDVCGCVISPISGIYWVELGFINNCKEPQLWLVLLRYNADVASGFPWVITWQLSLATWLSRESKLWVNWMASLGLLSYNATAGVTLQLPCMLHMCVCFSDLPAMSQSRDPVARPCWVAHF